MKKLTTLFLLVFPFLTVAQERTLRFTIVDSATSKPMTKKWGTILKNDNGYIDFVRSNKSGICTFTDRRYNSTATYQFEIINSWNNYVQPGYYDITAVKKSPVVVKLLPATYSVSYTCGEVMYPHYQARQSFTMEQLPVTIQSKIKTYLVDRVGNDFYKKLMLNSGQWVDLKKFYTLNPKIAQKKNHPPTYSLCIMVWDTVSHNSLYNFSLRLNENGKLMGIIELPDIKHHPEKAKIIDSAVANLVAKQNNFPADGHILYNNKIGSIVWEFKKYRKGEDEYTIVDRLWVDAHTAVIAERKTTNEIIME